MFIGADGPFCKGHPQMKVFLSTNAFTVFSGMKRSLLFWY